MRWSEVVARPSDRKLREFAATFAVVLFGLAIYQALAGANRPLAALYAGVAVCAGFVGIVRPRWLAPIFVGWMVVAFPIAWIVSTLVLVAIFFGLVTPLAFVFRALGRDALDRKLKPDHDSYWKVKPSTKQTRSYLRQF